MGGQIFSFSLAGFVVLQSSCRFRRRGDAKTAVSQILTYCTGAPMYFNCHLLYSALVSCCRERRKKDIQYVYLDWLRTGDMNDTFYESRPQCF